ncbi:hypothetical protein B7P43_G12325 [Cryptotermes secundus]|uniref:Fringe-like glycosyltransferase domain-containing protein n=1 Tax=Cryptotermes secundus TaxID=105785 RepID=A0A2J7RQ04_9NEOP|nr:hypothetical protein B7P43_G12325 [Cryptotermes secundus]
MEFVFSFFSGGKFISIGEKIRLPDDVTMGYIIEHLLRKPLTVIDQFHSHLEPMKFLRQDTFHDQVSTIGSHNVFIITTRKSQLQNVVLCSPFPELENSYIFLRQVDRGSHRKGQKQNGYVG